MKFILAFITIFAMALPLAATGGGQEKVTICHAAGLEGTTKYVTITIAEPAVYGPAGHFEENGTPQAGHEQDYFGECIDDETTTTTTPEETTTTQGEDTTTTEHRPNPTTTVVTVEPKCFDNEAENEAGVCVPATQPTTPEVEVSPTTTVAPVVLTELPFTGVPGFLIPIGVGLLSVGSFLARKFRA